MYSYKRPKKRRKKSVGCAHRKTVDERRASPSLFAAAAANIAGRATSPRTLQQAASSRCVVAGASSLVLFSPLFSHPFSFSLLLPSPSLSRLFSSQTHPLLFSPRLLPLLSRALHSSPALLHPLLLSRVLRSPPFSSALGSSLM